MTGAAGNMGSATIAGSRPGRSDLERSMLIIREDGPWVWVCP